MKFLKKKLELKPNFTLRLFLLSQVISAGFLQAGFGLGFPSPTLSQLREQSLLDDSTYQVFISLFVAGLALGNLISIPGAKFLGRKLVAIASSLSTSAGLLLITAATNPAFLLAGRVFHGLGAGLISSIIPVYLGEISPASSRGFLSGFQGLYEVLGALAVYVLGSFLSFRWLSVMGVAVSLVHTSLLMLAPLSPTWLYSRGLEQRARGVLQSLRYGDVLEECHSIGTALRAEADLEGSCTQCRLLLTGYRLRAVCVGVFLGVGFISTGTDIVTSYTSPLLEGAGGLNPNVPAIGVPALGVLGALLALLLVELCGRKRLLLLSAVLVTLSLLSLAGYFLADEMLLGCATWRHNDTSGTCRWLVLWPGVSLGVGRFGFQIGWGSVVYVITGEMFPIRIKELAAGALLVALNTHAIVILTAFPFVAAAIGNGYTFLALGCVNIATCVCIALFLPETRGLSADEIEEIFQENSLLCGVSRTDAYSVKQRECY